MKLCSCHCRLLYVSASLHSTFKLPPTCSYSSAGILRVEMEKHSHLLPPFLAVPTATATQSAPSLKCYLNSQLAYPVHLWHTVHHGQLLDGLPEHERIRPSFASRTHPHLQPALLVPAEGQAGRQQWTHQQAGAGVQHLGAAQNLLWFADSPP